MSTTFQTGLVSSTTNSTGTLSAKTDFIGTLTGRLGYTQDRTMIYVKGGAAWAHDKYSFNGQLTNVFCTFPVAPCSQFSTSANSFSFNSSETRIGWTIGGGLEWAFWNNWSVRLEYDYLDFGARNVNFTGAITGGVVPGVPVGEGATVGSQTIGVRQRISEVKLGLSYLFNYGPRF
ncbi:MAG TPA: outer membrane beta-barrel protein [Pseudolabrys sp.]|nr:outer membrane beta-barrel protein [Pseudolabrys sp.]